MRALVQRVSRASVTVEDSEVGAVVGSIGPGLCVLIGVTHEDTEAKARKLAERLCKLRIFGDDEGKMNRSVADVGGGILIVSQFTLYADTRKGNRPSYVDAARPEVAEPLIEILVEHLRSLGTPLGVNVETGRFRTEMAVELVNDGPVTITLDL